MSGDWREWAWTQRPYREEEQAAWDRTTAGQVEELLRTTSALVVAFGNSFRATAERLAALAKGRP